MTLASISILSAVWNESAHIDEMIESVRAQDFTDWELVFVDDGSTDDTAEKIEQWQERDPRVRLAARHDHRGKVAAFNAAFRASKNDLISLLAGDDKLPEGALRMRSETLSPWDPRTVKAVTWGKIRTFSEDPKEDGILMPRGDAPSRSGGASAMTRALADLVFPIPEVLPNEDSWVRVAAEELAEHEVCNREVFLHYRLHSGNTSPRHLPFDEFLKVEAKRQEVWRLLLEEPRLHFGYSARRRIEQRWQAEQLRRKRSLLGLARLPRMTLLEKAAIGWKANPLLYRLRWANYGFFNGRMGA